MIVFGSNTKVYLAIGATDMRKAVNGLMVLVQDVLQADPRGVQRGSGLASLHAVCCFRRAHDLAYRREM
jgi:hypothetical protein